MTRQYEKTPITDPTRILTLANLISILRAFLTFPLIYSMTNPDWMLYTFIIIAIAVLSDALDGYFARRAHAVTHFGKLLDPLADAVIIIAVTFFLVIDQSRNFPLWYLIFFLIRYLSITLFAMYLINHTEHEFGANQVGKISVMITSLTLALYIFNSPYLYTFRLICMWVSVGFLLVSWYLYIREYIFVFKSLKE
ncbi:MAG: CDP-alcohol phosphatidyltransferase family protein [Candidatus Marinimicrobia bacterium]|nr:CDP-alcohol phosphatidyltransferase family protein [Candidatus Neomarinimicrobiota bacterium]